MWCTFHLHYNRYLVAKSYAMPARKTVKHQLDLFTKRFSKQKREPFKNIEQRIKLAVTLMESVTQQKFANSQSTRTVKNAARKNFVINIVTAFEIYFNEIIVANIGKWSQSGIDEILGKEKITLLEALEFRKGTRIHAEHLIVFHNRLQNPDSINKLFTTLIGQDFFKALDDHTILLTDFDRDESYDESLETLVSNWKQKFYELYTLRNRIAHEDVATDLKKDFINEIGRLAYAIAYIVMDYIYHR